MKTNNILFLSHLVRIFTTLHHSSSTCDCILVNLVWRCRALINDIFLFVCFGWFGVLNDLINWKSPLQNLNHLISRRGNVSNWMIFICVSIQTELELFPRGLLPPQEVFIWFLIRWFWDICSLISWILFYEKN